MIEVIEFKTQVVVVYDVLCYVVLIWPSNYFWAVSVKVMVEIQF